MKNKGMCLRNEKNKSLSISRAATSIALEMLKALAVLSTAT